MNANASVKYPTMYDSPLIKKTFKYESFCMSLISGYIFTQDI